MKYYIFLAIAIIAEVVATSGLKASEGFSKFAPSAVTVVGYSIAFYFLSLTLKVIPVGMAYAMWSGIGIVLISIIAYFLFGQKPDLPGVIGIGLIVAGVIVINAFSNSSAH